MLIYLNNFIILPRFIINKRNLNGKIGLNIKWHISEFR